MHIYGISEATVAVVASSFTHTSLYNPEKNFSLEYFKSGVRKRMFFTTEFENSHFTILLNFGFWKFGIFFLKKIE